ncbi:hypothetical protein D9M73_168650 [compost metagenome]
MQAGFSFENGGLLGTFGTGDVGFTFTLGSGLAFHGRLHVFRGFDVLDLDRAHGHAPVFGLLRHRFTQARLDLFAAGEGFVQIHGADNGPQRGHGQAGDGVGEILHPVGGFLRIDDLGKAQRVGDDDGVVAGDDFLLLHVEDDVLGRKAIGDHVHIGNDDVQAGLEGGVIATQALDDPLLALRHDTHPFEQSDDDERGDGPDDDKAGHESKLPFLLIRPG